MTPEPGTPMVSVEDAMRWWHEGIDYWPSIPAQACEHAVPWPAPPATRDDNPPPEPLSDLIAWAARNHCDVSISSDIAKHSEQYRWDVRVYNDDHTFHHRTTGPTINEAARDLRAALAAAQQDASNE